AYFNLEILCLKQSAFDAMLRLTKSGTTRREHSTRSARRMKVAVLGGGPAGLYFAISMKLRDAAHEITVYERNRADDTFGWGVVLSDETLDNLAVNDPKSAAA